MNFLLRHFLSKFFKLVEFSIQFVKKNLLFLIILLLSGSNFFYFLIPNSVFQSN